MNKQHMSEYIFIMFPDLYPMSGLSESDIKAISETFGYRAFVLKKELHNLYLALFFHNCASCKNNLFRFQAKFTGITFHKGNKLKWYDCKLCGGTFLKRKKKCI